MARIAGIDLPNKSAKIALTYIYGIGRTSAVKICEATGIDADKKINDLTPEEVNSLRKVIETVRGVGYRFQDHPTIRDVFMCSSALPMKATS